MATPGELGPFADRRLRFAAALGDALAIIPGAQEARRNGDVNYEFRQSSDFFFLTGFDEPDAVAVVNPAHTKERYVLFVRPRDRELEIWTGHRAGVEGAVATYGADAAYPIDKLDDKLREYLVDRPVVYYRLGQGAFDGRVTRLVVELRGARARGYPAPVRLEDPGPILHEMRLRRSPAELARQRRACELSRDAHVEAMRYARPGLYEYQVQAALEFVFRSHGSPRNAYPSIVASGPNACILHYVENTRQMADGDLLHSQPASIRSRSPSAASGAITRRTSRAPSRSTGASRGPSARSTRSCCAPSSPGSRPRGPATATRWFTRRRAAS